MCVVLTCGVGVIIVRKQQHRDTICTRKKAGGLGVRNIKLWNKAAITKYIQAIATKHDNLWIKWAHYVYIKDDDCWGYVPPSNSSCYWKQICKMKKEIKNFIYREEFLAILVYSVKKNVQHVDWRICEGKLGHIYLEQVVNPEAQIYMLVRHAWEVENYIQAYANGTA